MTYASYKKRKRNREVDYEKIEEMRDVLQYNKEEMSALLGITSTQLYRYSLCGKAPADRVYAARDAILIAIEDEARSKRDKIVNLFGSD